MAYCSQCGQQMADGVKFCPHCGAAQSNSSQTQNDAGTGGGYTGNPYGGNPYGDNHYYGNPYGGGYNGASEPELSLFGYFKKCLTHYADANGRARRKEYWGYVLFYTIFYVCAYLAASIIDAIIDFPLFTSIVSLATLAFIVPSICAAIRRLHDIGKSGWWYLIALIPLIGGIWLLILLATDSEPRPNMYGPPVKPVTFYG